MLPAWVRDQKRWMRWTRTEDGRKMPVAGWGKTGEPMTFAEARKGGSRVGLILGEVDGRTLCGVDLDDCIDHGRVTDPKIRDSVLMPWGQDVIDRFPSYTERSPSGTGLKIITLGGPPHLTRTQMPVEGGGQIEAYVGGRWFAFTGVEWYGGRSNTLAECDEGWHWLVDLLGATTTRGERRPPDYVIEPYELGLLLEYVPVEDYHDYHRWRALMMSCHHVTDSHGKEAFVDWSTGDPAYSDHALIIEGMWDKLDSSGGIGWGPLIQALREAGAMHAVPVRATRRDDK